MPIAALRPVVPGLLALAKGPGVLQRAHLY